jgi:hypothetical protein
MSNIINQDCPTCLACEGEEGIMRDGKGKKEEQTQEVLLRAR